MADHNQMMLTRFLSQRCNLFNLQCGATRLIKQQIADSLSYCYGLTSEFFYLRLFIICLNNINLYHMGQKNHVHLVE